MLWRVQCFWTCWDDENWLACQGPAQIDLIKSFSLIRHSGAEGKGKIRTNEISLAYELVIGSK